jgi:hypothetical protein
MVDTLNPAVLVLFRDREKELESGVLEEFRLVGASLLLYSLGSSSFAQELLLRFFGNRLLIQVSNFLIFFFKFATLLSALILVAP